jgi:hypothetical protein
LCNNIPYSGTYLYCVLFCYQLKYFYVNTNHYHRPGRCRSYSLAREYLHTHAKYNQNHSKCGDCDNCHNLVAEGIWPFQQFAEPAYLICIILTGEPSLPYKINEGKR